MRIGLRIAGAVVLAAGVFAGAALRPLGERDISSTARASLAASDSVSLVPSLSGASIEGTIAGLQERIRAFPQDWRASANLGIAYVQQARVSTDPSFHAKAEEILERSLEFNRERNDAAMIGMATLAAARHDFGDALRWGERALAIDPYDANAYGVIGDALVELGRYREAFDAFQRMADLRPGLASFARISYARELSGDVPGAITAMRAAADLAGSPSDAAWANHQLGELYWGDGRIALATERFRRAIRLDPGFVPPRAGLARVAWARGDLDAAIRRYLSVVRMIPSPEHVIALGDLYALAGDAASAQRQYGIVRAEAELFRANGVNIDLEQALFEADRGDARAALRAARAEWDRRRSIHVADAMAWALYANGRYREAAAFSDRALSLGTRDALLLFHAGMIRLRLGEAGRAATLLRAAVETNPWFSIRHSTVARETLAGLDGPA